MAAKRYGRLATRLYLILFLSGLIILICYTIIEPRITTTTFDEPSFDYYNNLKAKYDDQLTCSCSVIASTHTKFVEIKSVLHSVRYRIDYREDHF